MAIAQNNEDAEKIYQMGFENTTAFDSDEQRGAITGINRKRTETQKNIFMGIMILSKTE